MKRKSVWLIGFLLVLSALIFLRFGEYFYTPNSRVIEPWGDGFKAYHVILYHARYDTTYSHFQGMNYPYGEHVVPAATQPVLSNTIRFISKHLFDITGYTFAIVHFSMLLSILLCGLFLYRIFRKFKLPPWYCALVSIGLVFLSPQIERMGSHYGLAHPVVLPMIIFLLWNFHQRPVWTNSLWIALAVFLVSQIHFYYFAILTFTVGFYFLFRFLQQPGWYRLFQSGVQFGIQIILPLLFFVWWMYYNDPVTDRTDSPWGFFAYRAHLEGIFTSLTQPHWRFFDENLVNIRRVDLEGRAYIGMMGSIFLVAILMNFIRRRFRMPIINIPEREDSFWNALFWAALVIMIFSLGFPFIIDPLEPLLQWTGPIRQFRSIGRFAWLFFYVINIIGFAWLYYRVRESKSILARAVIYLSVVVLLYEGYHFCRHHDLVLDSIAELEPGNRFSDIDSIDYSRYQAILPVPYYNIGSDNFWWPLSGFIGQKTMTLSMQTGLPVTGAMLTRTSLSQTMNQIQLVTEPYRFPKILADFPNDKPLLMAWDEVRVREQGDRYDHLLEVVEKVYQNEPLRLFEIPLSSFRQRIGLRRSRIEKELAEPLFSHGPFLSTDSLFNFYYQSYDTLDAVQAYQGGGYEGIMNGENIIFEGQMPNQQGGRYSISFWMFLEKDLYPRTTLEYFEYGPGKKEEVRRYHTDVRTMVKAIDNNGWALLELTFEIRDENSGILFKLYNKDLGGDPIYLDEILIRPKGTHLYRKTDTFIWKNNRWFKLGILG